jgi:hypothetical protein
MPNKVYLEFLEEDLQFVSSGIFMGEDEFNLTDLSFPSVDDDDNNQEAVGPEPDETIVFMPVQLYREPINGAYELETDLDPKEYDRLHLVVVRYSVGEKEEPRLFGKWHIEGVYPSRRVARDVQDLIETNEYPKEDVPWLKDGCRIEDVEVVSLNVED